MRKGIFSINFLLTGVEVLGIPIQLETHLDERSKIKKIETPTHKIEAK